MKKEHVHTDMAEGLEKHTLPQDFITQTTALLGTAQWERLRQGLEDEAPVSIRLNTQKTGSTQHVVCADGQVPWCADGWYLDHRPAFTFDPLLHAGVYYVQEASSMFIDFVLRQLVKRPVCMLDLCAAPGGKSTAARSALPAGSLLVSNEPISTRAQILAENIVKWGHADCIVTSNYPEDYGRSGEMFDVVLCDVPCSGEGMFRKDPQAIDEWSLQNVEKCWRLQRDIVSEAWKSLLPGGLLVYSTCTFNTKENEENIRFFMETLGAQPVSVETEAAWNITGSLLQGFDAPVYRFMPGFTRGEGLFMCVLRKGGDEMQGDKQTVRKAVGKKLHTLYTGDMEPTAKGKNLIPVHAEALFAKRDPAKYPMAELSYEQAISYLRREAIVLPEGTPRGIVVVCFRGYPLGFAKNIGNRANNLYPQNWKIKSSHTPSEYETILSPA